MLEVSSVYCVTSTLNILCNSNDIKLNLNVRPRGLIKVGHVVLNVITYLYPVLFEVYGWRYSYFQMSWKIEAFSLCVILTKAPSGPPWD